MKVIHSKVLIAVITCVSLFPSALLSKSINDVLIIHRHSNAYLLLGSFSHKNNAEHLKEKIQARTGYPVKISKISTYYVVRMGPLSTKEANKVAQTISIDTKIPEEPLTGQNNALTNIIFAPGNVFVAGYVGMQYLNVDNHYSEDNGSDYPPPYNVDYYSTNNTNPTANFAIEAGYRWLRNQKFIPAYAISFRYQHSLEADIGGQITQYSLPEFTNYSYRWNISSNIFLVMAKMNLLEWHHLLPYLSGGIGMAFNRASGFKETAFANVTPRVSPGFGSNTRSQLAYNLGAGMDWQVHPKVIFSLDYEFQELDSVASSAGVSSWAGNKLYSRRYQTNSVMIGVTYLFDPSP